MMLVIIDLLDDRQGSDPVYEERFAGSRWRWMAISAASPFGGGHEQSGPVRIRTRERPARRPGRTAGGAVRTRDLLALRFPADGLRVPGSAGVRLRHRSRCTPSRPWTITATGIRVTRTRPTKARGLRTAAQLLTVQQSAAASTAFSDAAAPRPSGDPATGHPRPAFPGTTSRRSAIRPGPGTRGPGYQPQGFVPPSGGQEIWPVTGAQEALPDTGPQPIAPPVAPPAADAWSGRGSGRSPQAASPAYPDQWYDNPRLDDRVRDDVRHDQPRPGGSRLTARRPARARPIRGSRA